MDGHRTHVPDVAGTYILLVYRVVLQVLLRLRLVGGLPPRLLLHALAHLLEV